MSVFDIRKLGIAVSTFTEEATDPYRYEIIERSLTSLVETIKNKPDYIVIEAIIIIDGRVPKKHEDLIKSFSSDLEVIQRPENGGVSKVKNTGIRVLLEKSIDVGILVDDDVLFRNGWIDTYVGLIKNLQLHHLAWNDKRIFEDLKITKPDSGALKSFSYVQKKGYQLIKHPGTCGIFLSFTPDLIDKIGYFKVMPGKIGNEHQHFTIRANRAGMIGHPIDLENSYEFIDHIGVLENKSDISNHKIVHSVSDQFRENENKNSGLSKTDLDGFFPCIE